jgi:thioredoxin
LKEKHKNIATEPASEKAPVLGHDILSKNEEAPFFIVSTTKLIVMSLCTFGLYEFYWFYKNWKSVKKNIKRKISPFWRSVFAVLFFHGFLKIVREYANDKKVECKYNVDLLALIYMLLSISWRVPDPFWIIACFSFIPLLSAQKTINNLKEKISPNTDSNSRFSTGNIILVVLGVIIIFSALGALIMNESTNIGQQFKSSKGINPIKTQYTQDDIIKKQKLEFTFGEEIFIEGTVMELDPISYDDKVFTKSVVVSGYQDNFLIITEDGQVETALKSILKKGTDIQMNCRNLDISGDNNQYDSVKYLYCDQISFQGVNFGEETESESDVSWEVPVVLDNSNLNKIIDFSHKKPVLIDFYADWCHWCKVLEPTFVSMAQEKKEEVLFARLDTQRYKDLAVKYNIKGLPTIILFVNGKPVKIQSGAGRNDHENRQLINRVLSTIFQK